MLALEDDQGIFFVNEFDIASLTPEHGGRWRAVLKDGTVAHCYTIGQGPWRKLGDCWVIPQHLSSSAEGYRDPADFWLGLGDLERVGEPEDESPLPGLPFRLKQVLGVRILAGRCTWRIETGEFQTRHTPDELAKLSSNLVMIVRGHYVNLQRLGRIRLEDREFVFYSDGGIALTTVSLASHREAAARFGLPHFYHLEPRNEALARWALRDWPCELALARADFLKTHFHDARILIMNVVWQIVRRRRLGSPLHYSDDYRGLFYDTLYHTLYRAGLMTRAELDADELYTQFQLLIAQAVSEDRLFTFQELGLADSNEHRVNLGTTNPHIVVVAEKSSLRKNLDTLRERYGVTTIVTCGQPKLLCVEYFARALRSVVKGPLRVIAYVDFDPAGWIIAKTMVRMLNQNDWEVSQLQYLVKAHHFTVEEIELFAVALPTGTGTINRKWLEESGGFAGRPLGMHCTHLRPLERVLAAFEEVF